MDIDTASHQSPPTPPLRSGAAARFTRWLPPVLIILASLLVGIVHVPQHNAISPIDEYVYIDYYAKVLDQGVVRQGEEVGHYARQELGCRGLRILAPAPDDRCSPAIADDDARFPMGGITSADIYTPLYFGVTRVVAQPLLWLGVTDSLTQAGRFAGVFWLAAAGLLLFSALRRLKIGPWAGTGITLLLVGSMPAYWFNTYISTDAPTMFAGALLALLTVRYLQGAGSGWWLVLAAPVITLLKFQNVAVIGAVALTLLFAAFSASAGPFWTRLRGTILHRHTRFAALAVVAAVLAQGAWTVVRALISLGPSPDQGTANDYSLHALLNLMFKYLPGSGTGVDATSTGAMIVTNLAVWIAVAGVLGLVVTAKPGTLKASFAYGTLLMALLIGPLLATAVRISTGYYFSLPERYGLSLFPLFLIAAAVFVQQTERRAPVAVLGALGVVSYAAMLTVPS
ncbi:hypothetical protein [Microterricola viridarii]|uniref:Glycosyltransferase RgtA/B/C/D-like domain-containing protein n=1 Tax=Microterricola viridarii TaxID=412690 RepID=A0A1H1QXM2_9MICO|nr:hypothetical protein [Microterricola viridarii]SDS28258.1 hypothetical protein SAMN04489834_1194 [Microterricola viridarii]